MDTIKIGKFIAKCRKDNNLTQKQLANKLSVTDRAISKWETGKSMPDSSIMLDLCKELKITVNDLLSGEVVSMDNYNKEMEIKLLEMIKQKEEYDKRLLMLEYVIGILSLFVLLIPIIIGALIPLDNTLKTIICFSGFMPSIIGFCFSMRLEQIAGYYECHHCKYKYVPTYKAMTLAPHIGRTRYMKCPKCKKKSWQKKVINKD